jgi:hypothetical protein
MVSCKSWLRAHEYVCKSQSQSRFFVPFPALCWSLSCSLQYTPIGNPDFWVPHPTVGTWFGDRRLIILAWQFILWIVSLHWLERLHILSKVILWSHCFPYAPPHPTGLAALRPCNLYFRCHSECNLFISFDNAFHPGSYWRIFSRGGRIQRRCATTRNVSLQSLQLQYINYLSPKNKTS